MSESVSDNKAANYKSRSILELKHNEAREFFLKNESYCDLDLPKYFTFNKLLKSVNNVLDGLNKRDSLISEAKKYDDVNYKILSNKDGSYAWRPFELIHPAIYVSLVQNITTEDNWGEIQEKFKEEFAKIDNIKCCSLPRVPLGKKKDKAEQISHWWQEIEQKSIELSLDYEYLFETDLTDCYASMYTHSIAWALHTKELAKMNRTGTNLIGNNIDRHIQCMRYSQTNGIPQGSVLMNFIAEMILGYADTELAKRIDHAKLTDYVILRYRDDYRIFVNNPQTGESILKLLTEVMIDLGLKLNPVKTKLSKSVIRGSIKADKLSWIIKNPMQKNLEKDLLIIHDHSMQFPNSGSLISALSDYLKRVERAKSVQCDQALVLISIVVDIAYHNPRTYPFCAVILSILLSFVKDENTKLNVIMKIIKKFSTIPNTGYMEIWLQRAAISFANDSLFNESLCKLVSGKKPKIKIWNNEWISSKPLKDALNIEQIIDKVELDKAKREQVIPPSEVNHFYNKY
ncbi:MAG: RNA-directed DNA polymerase [Candidatus Heimdallarchaeaceae archaeon]